MKYLLLNIVLFFIVLDTVKGQDLILTNKGDSIECKIKKVTFEYVYYSGRQPGEIEQVKIPAAEVKFYEKNYYVSKGSVSKTRTITNHTYDKFSIGAYGGFSYLIAKISSQVPADFRQYMKELKSGYHFGGDVTYYLSRRTGVGLKYNNFKTSNEANVTSTSPSGQRNNGVMRDDITIQYIAPVLASRQFSVNNKTIFHTGFSLGYLDYTNNATLVEQVTISGNTVGVGLDLGLESKLSKILGLEFKLGMIAGSLGKIEKSQGGKIETVTLEKEQRENLSRVDVSIGLKRHF